MAKTGPEAADELARAENGEVGHVCPAAQRLQTCAAHQALERIEGEVANVPVRSRTGVELDGVGRAAQDKLHTTAERDQVRRGERQPPARPQYASELVQH